MTKGIPSAYAPGHDLERTTDRVVVSRWVCQCGREFTNYGEWAQHQLENGIDLTKGGRL